MRYSPPRPEFFASNRSRFMQLMAPGTAGVFFANELAPVNGDSHHRFKQNYSTYYLLGLDQEDVMLWLWPQAPKDTLKEVAFVKRTNEHIQVWEGWKYSLAEAAEASGLKEVHYLDEWEGFFRKQLSQIQGLYLDINEHERNSLVYLTPAHRLAHRMQREYPTHPLHRAAPTLARLRMEKQPEELEQLRRAITITHAGFTRALKAIRPGVKEYEVEAEITHEFVRQGASHAFDPIMAGGKNACVLHYTQNHAPLRAGDALLMDFGAEYGNYSADITRVVPISGRFSLRQRQVYEAVLRIQQAANESLIPGKTQEDYIEHAGKAATEELLRLGLITQTDVNEAPEHTPAYKKYFMHGIGHFLGLDTHDVGSRYLPFTPGMVLTNEPGIYIPEEGIGMRLENDMLISQGAPENLTAGIPIMPDDIEALMDQR